jgi:RNA polymerase sigma factor (sigma-70 family)
MSHFSCHIASDLPMLTTSFDTSFKQNIYTIAYISGSFYWMLPHYHISPAMKFLLKEYRIKRKAWLTTVLLCFIPCKLFFNNYIFGSGFSNHVPVFSRIPTICKPAKSPALLGHHHRIFNDRRPCDANFSRMRHEDHQVLLTKTVEMRRIIRIKSEITHQAGNVTPLTLTLSKACGYGDEIDLLERAIADGEAARENLITGNIGLVHFCVNDIMKNRRAGSHLQSLCKEDLVQEGAIGLARAVDRWNPLIGGRFSTYAVYWIRACVLRCIAERDDFVKVPEHVSAAVRKLSRAANSLGVTVDEEKGVFLSVQWKQAKAAKALAEEAGLSERQFIEAMKIRERRRTGIISLESWMTERKMLKTRSEDIDYLYEINATHVKSTLSKFLRPKEVEALSWRYGLNNETQENKAISAKLTTHSLPTNSIKKKWLIRGKNGEALSFSEVGSKMHISAEYGRRLCRAALDKLKRAVAEGLLEPALLCL